MFHTPKEKLIPYSIVLPQKLTVPHLVEDSPQFMEPKDLIVLKNKRPT